jgi:hypothetical protein
MIFKGTLKSLSKFHYNCMVVCDGQIIGTWKRSFTANAVNVEFEFFRPPDKKQHKALNRAVHRLGEFINMTVNDVSK